MHVNDIILLIREYVDEPTEDGATGDFPDSSLIQFINMEHRHLFSVVRQTYEDWFGRDLIFLPVTGQSDYLLPRDMIGVRRVEFVNQNAVTAVSDTSVTPAYNYFTVDESIVQSQDVTPVELNTKDGANFLNTNSRHRALEGYVLWDDYIKFTNGTNLDNGRYCRIFYTPTCPDLHRATAQGGGSNYLDLGATGATTTLGTIKNVDKYYVGMYLEIVSGPGVGEIKKIIRHDPVSGRVWVDSNWTTNPTGSSVYSIVSPVKEDFQELLALGAAMRAKGIKTEDDTTLLGQMYGAVMEDLNSALEKRLEQTSRRVINTTRFGIWN